MIANFGGMILSIKNPFSAQIIQRKNSSIASNTLLIVIIILTHKISNLNLMKLKIIQTWRKL